MNACGFDFVILFQQFKCTRPFCGISKICDMSTFFVAKASEWIKAKYNEHYIGQNVDEDYFVRVISLFEVVFNTEVILNLHKL